MKENLRRSEKLFEGLKVYFSGSIKGAEERDPELAWGLVRFMAEHGADVLSEHVAARSQEERDEIFADRTGQTIESLLSQEEPWWGIRKTDMEWVDEASHLVALVNAPSLGVGMEIERAIHKPARGLNETPILGLVHESVYDRLSFMVKGISHHEAKFRLKTYQVLSDAQGHIKDFLID